MQQKSLLYAVAEIVASIETDIESIAETVSACSDSNYNQYAMSGKRRTQNGTLFNACVIDDECREYSIIYLFEIFNPQ